MREIRVEEVQVNVEARGSQVYVSSTDVPGLWLWGSDPGALFDQIPSAIEALYRHNRGERVRVEPALRTRAADRWASVKREVDRFVVHVLDAASQDNGARRV